MGYNKLTREQERVIVNKATEPPFTGEYDDFYEDGIFICRGAMHLSFRPKANSMPDVAGQALMKRYQTQLDIYLILMA
jgi:SelR domain